MTDHDILEVLVLAATFTASVVAGVAFISRHRALALVVAAVMLIFGATIEIIGYWLGIADRLTWPPGTTPMALKTAIAFFGIGLCLIIVASLFLFPKYPRPDEAKKKTKEKVVCCEDADNCKFSQDENVDCKFRDRCKGVEL